MITLLRLLARSRPDPRLIPEEKISRSRRVSLQWCRPAHFVAGPMRMQALISSSSWSSAVLLLSRGVSQDAIRLRLFPFSLLGRAKQWFYANKAAVDTWDKCAKAFLSKFFPTGKTNALRDRIWNFQQASNESIPEAWERLQEYILACPHHGMDNWLIL